MRIIFVNVCSPFLLNDKGAPPLGVLQLAAIVRERGLAEVAVWDMTGDASLAEQFGSDCQTFISRGNFNLPAWLLERPDETILALTSTSSQYHSACNVLLAAKRCVPGMRVIIGGSHVSALPDEALHDGFHAVFAGEADDALPQWLRDGCPYGIVHCMAPRGLDRLPFPARDLVNVQSYCSNMTMGEGLSSTLMHSRGCSFACKYCVRTLGDAARLVRVRSVESALREADHLSMRYGIYRFVAVDDIWGIKRPWVERFCEVFGQSRFQFRVNCRANTLHFDLLPEMKRAGIDCISFGFESGDERVLHAISKNNVALNTKAVRACHDAGIFVKAYLIFGFAEDDGASVEATCRWIEEARPDSAQVAWLIPLPGTPIYQQAMAGGWTPAYHQLYHNGKDRRGGMSRLPWHSDETAKYYEVLCEWLEAFYAQPQPAVQCPNALGDG